jgi:leucine dehydrogenase
MLIFMRHVPWTTINDTVYKIKAKIIAGAANNQLANEDVHGAILQERDIIRSDFLINAGGIINVYAELAHYDRRNYEENRKYL